MGKSYLLGSLFDMPPPGVTTVATPMKGVYLFENGVNNSICIGVYEESLPGTENKMRPCKEAFEKAGTEILNRLSLCEDEWITIDEIGYLETECPEYCDAIERLMKHKRVAAVVRKQTIPFLQSLCNREDVFIVDLDAPFGEAACVIMASGMGMRFGQNKLMADFRGEPMILRAIAATDGIFARRVVVTRHADVVSLCHSHGVESILHDLPHKNDTVRLGIEAVGDVDACVFCPGDQPLLRRETVASLALAAKNCRNQIWRVCFEDVPGAPMLFPQWAFESLAHLPQGKGGGFLAQAYPERVHTIDAHDRFELMDVDTPWDLAVLEAL